MKHHFYNLFLPHEKNNHKPKLLHHLSLSKCILIIFLAQLIISGIGQTRPGILGYASDISVEQIFELTNQQRAVHGLAPLELSETLAESASKKAADMFEQNYWAHNTPDGTKPWHFFKEAGYYYLYAGENLARDFGDAGSVMQAWMASPSHRDNVLSGRYNEIGIAVVNGILNGQETTLVVQHFGRLTTSFPETPSLAASDSSLEGNAPPANLSQEAEVTNLENSEEIIVQIDTNTSTQGAPVQLQEAAGSTKRIEESRVSSFDLTKSINLGLTILVIIVLAIDAFLIWHRGTIRRSGKSFIHLSLFILVALIIILTNSGKIL